MVVQVKDIDLNVSSIVDSSRERAIGIEEIDSTVITMGPGNSAECRHG